MKLPGPEDNNATRQAFPRFLGGEVQPAVLWAFKQNLTPNYPPGDVFLPAFPAAKERCEGPKSWAPYMFTRHWGEPRRRLRPDYVCF